MKIIANRTEPLFQPINITITVESKEELAAIVEMASRNLSIPDLISDENKHSVIRFLTCLYDKTLTFSTEENKKR